MTWKLAADSLEFPREEIEGTSGDIPPCIVEKIYLYKLNKIQ